MTPARRIWDVVEPIAANVYFAPEVHRAYQEIGFDGPSRVMRGIEFPDMLAYFTSRGACLGDQRVGPPRGGGLRRVQAADGGGRRGGGLEAHRRAHHPGRPSRRAPPRRCAGSSATSPTAWPGPPSVLQRMAEAGPAEGRYLHSGLLSLGYPGTRWATSGGPPTSCASTGATRTSRRGSTPISTPPRSACSPIRGGASRSSRGCAPGAGPTTSSTPRAIASGRGGCSTATS